MALTEKELQEMALQLSFPQGDQGIQIAEMMHNSNFGMTKSTIEALKINDHETILELGHGGGKHIDLIVNKASNVSYVGLEISALMKSEAEAVNQTPATSFYLYDGETIPFNDNLFHKAMTVNTIYFWKNPVHTLNEVYRVLQPSGIFALCFAQKDFMEMLPFTKYGFTLYDHTNAKELIERTNFELLDFQSHREQIMSKNGEQVTRDYTVAILKK